MCQHETGDVRVPFQSLLAAWECMHVCVRVVACVYGAMVRAVACKIIAQRPVARHVKHPQSRDQAATTQSKRMSREHDSTQRLTHTHANSAAAQQPTHRDGVSLRPTAPLWQTHEA